MIIYYTSYFKTICREKLNENINFNNYGARWIYMAKKMKNHPINKGERFISLMFNSQFDGIEKSSKYLLMMNLIIYIENQPLFK